MADMDKKSGKVVLDIELQDLLDLVSKGGNRSPITNSIDEHYLEGEDLRKAWFKHVLISIEKLADLIETVRREDLANLRTEFKGEMVVMRQEIKEAVAKIEQKAEKAEDELKIYKKDVIEPLNNRLTAIVAKLGVWSIIAGLIGSGILTFILYLINEFIIKPAASGGP